MNALSDRSLLARSLAVLLPALALGLALFSPGPVLAVPASAASLVGLEDDGDDEGGEDDSNGDSDDGERGVVDDHADDTDDGAIPVGGVDTGGGGLAVHHR